MIYFIQVMLIGISLFGFGMLIMWILLKPKLKKNIQRNEEILKENQLILKNNQLLKETNNELKIQSKNLQDKVEGFRQEALAIKYEYHELQARKEEVKNSLNDLEKQSTDAAQKFYKPAQEIAQSSFEKEIENMSNDLDKEREKIQNLYLNLTKDCVKEFQQEIDEKNDKIIQLDSKINQLQKNVDAAVAEAIRRQEMENQQDFYRITLNKDDIAEIQHLREILPYLRDKTPLNKVIYKVYYEKPLTDMISRVVGTGIHTGIYKITHIDSGKCYVGQAANIADRWKQHCKRGVGAEDWTRNKLYPAMYSLGVENFSFEIIEECSRAQLNEREDYWQDFFHAKDFGYSIK